MNILSSFTCSHSTDTVLKVDGYLHHQTPLVHTVRVMNNFYDDFYVLFGAF